MVCVYCSGATHIVNSRAQKRSNSVWRRRKCRDCGLIFSTEESVQYENIWLVVDPSGSYSPFSLDRLQMSLYRSCQHRQVALKDAAALTRTIIQKLRPKFSDGLISSQTIAQVSQVALNRFDRAASVNYGAYHRQRNHV
jgi:transcriptional regulator NrdR family protein